MSATPRVSPEAHPYTGQRRMDLTSSHARLSRRLHQRFPIRAEAEYIVEGRRGPATTRDISSGGVFLRTDAILKAGEPVQVWIDWPARLDGRRLRLVFFGRVVRSNEAGTAVEATRYEFRVCAQKQARPESSLRPLRTAGGGLEEIWARWAHPRAK